MTVPLIACPPLAEFNDRVTDRVPSASRVSRHVGNADLRGKHQVAAAQLCSHNPHVLRARRQYQHHRVEPRCSPPRPSRNRQGSYQDTQVNVQGVCVCVDVVCASMLCVCVDVVYVCVKLCELCGFLPVNIIFDCLPVFCRRHCAKRWPTNWPCA